MDKVIDEFRSSTRRWLIASFSGWLTILLCFTGVGFLILFLVWWRNFGSRFELTEQRLILHRGILLKSTDEIELYRIKDVRVDYSIISQIADIGTLTITSSDRTTRFGALRIPALPEAKRRREELRNLVEAARKRRGVREFDMDS